jgi:type I restriction enzyme S subunit
MSLLNAQLPDGWEWQMISDRYRITKKSRDISFADFNTIPFVAMEAVPIGGQHEVTADLREPKKISSGSYFEKGDVLLPKITPSFENGKQGIGTITSDFGVGSTELIPLQAIGADSNLFLFFYLLHPEVRHVLAEKMEGSTGRQRIPEHVVRSFPVPIPPVAEQEKIAAVLWKVQRAIQTEEKLIATARELKRSTMHQLFTRGLRNEPQKETEIGPMPESWDVLSFGELREFLQYGTSAKCDYQQNGNAVLRIPNIVDGRILAEDLKFCELPDKEVKNLLLSSGDLLFVRTNGVRERVGSCSVYHGEPENCLFASYLIRARLKPELIDSDFFSYYAMTHAGTSWLSGQASPASDGKFNINTKTIDAVLTPVPGLEEQKEMVSVLKTIDRKVLVHERKRAALHDLFKTLLNQLMTGDIRVTDLNIDTSAVIINRPPTNSKKSKNVSRRTSMEYRPEENEILAALPQVKSAQFVATGGFKHVFRADVGGVEEALKVSLLPEDEEDDERTRRTARLEREIDVLSKCTTPSLVKLGSIKPATMAIAGRDYFVYSEEWLPGQPLTEVIKTGQQTTFDEVLSLTTSLMEALSEINSTDHIHRDVKPANIMATGMADRPFVLLDLGIAFKVQGTELTGPGAGVAPGTTRYMAPESFSPSYKSSVDIRADIYSAGTTNIEFAAGQHPLVKKHEDVFTTRDRIMNYTPPKLETFRSDFPEWFCLLIDRTIKKNPSLRYRDPNAVLEEIKKNL